MKFIPSTVKYTSIAPNLQSILEMIEKKRPLIEYEVTNASAITDLATKVKCWQHGQCIGAIDVSYSRYSEKEGQNIKWIAVFSRHIKKERGSDGVRFTKKPETAAKIALEVLIKDPLSTLAAQVHTLIKETVGSMVYQVHSSYRYAMSVNDHAVMEYFVKLKIGENPEPPKMIMDKIDDVVLAKRDTYMIGNNVAKHVESMNGYGVCPMIDETYLFFDLADHATASKVTDLESLPNFVQEKLAILKVLEPNQFARDIGVKFYRDKNDEKTLTYFIVKGETVTY